MKRRILFLLVLSVIFLSALSLTASASGYPYTAYWDTDTGPYGWNTWDSLNPTADGSHFYFHTGSNSAYVRMRSSSDGGSTWSLWQNWENSGGGFNGATPPSGVVSYMCYQAQIMYNGVTYSTLYTSFTKAIDLADPNVSSLVPQNITPDGFDLYAYGVNDNDPNGVAGSGVREVKFAVDNGATEFRFIGTNDGNGTYHCHVNRSGYGDVYTGYKASVTVTDNVGLWSSRTIFGISLDNIPPVISYSPNSASWTNQAVPVTITCADTGSGIDHFTYQVSSDGGSTYGSSSTIYGNSTTVNLSGNGTYEITTTAYDKAGNSTTQNSGLYYIDMTPPTATFNPNGCTWQNSPESVTVTPSDSGGSGIKSYSIWSTTNNGGSWTQLGSGYTGAQPVTINTEGQTQLRVHIVDNAGNYANVYSNNYLLDLTPPTCAADKQTACSSSVTVNLTYADTGGSGLSGSYYAWSKSSTTEPGNMTAYTGAVTQKTNGKWYLWYYTNDHAKNSTTGVYGPYTVSTTQPDVTFDPNYSGWTNSPIAVTETPIDNGGVGIKYFSYQKSSDYGNTWLPTPARNITEGSSATINLTQQGVFSLRGFVTDKAGNSNSEQSGQYMIDLTPPTCAADNTGSSGQSATVNLTYADTGGSGLRYSKYCWSTDGNSQPSAWAVYSKSVPPTQTASGTWYLWYYAEDFAGNITVGNFGPYKISTAKPSVSYNPSSAVWRNTSVNVTITPIDNGGFGIKNYVYKISSDNGTTWGTPVTVTGGGSTNTTISAQGTYIISTTVTDNIGNVGTGTSGQYLLDLTPPTCTADNSSGTGQSETVNLTYADTGGSGLATESYAWSTSGTTVPSSFNSYSGAVTQSNNGTWYLWYKATDNAGNVTTGKYGPYTISTVKPSVTYNPPSAAWRNSPLSVTITPQDNSGSGIKNYVYKISSDSGTTWGTPVTVTGGGSTNTTISAQGTYIISTTVTDNIGNVGTGTSGQYLLDLTPPTCAADNTGSSGQSATVNLTYADTGGSGLATESYAWSSSGTTVPSSFNSYSGAVTQSNNGTWYLWYKATDNAGNATTGVYGPYTIQQPVSSSTPASSSVPVSSSQPASSSAPVSSSTPVSSSEPSSSSQPSSSSEPAPDVNNPPTISISPQIGGWINYNPSVLLSANDDYQNTNCGLSSVGYTIDGQYTSANIGEGQTAYTTALPVTGTGIHSVTANTVNLGGLAATASATYKIDEIPPSGYYNPYSHDWNTSSTTVFTPSDTGGSGVFSVRYRISTNNRQSWGVWSATSYSSAAITVSLFPGDNIVDAQVTDGAGNVSDIYSGDLKCALAKPSGYFNPNSASWTNMPISVLFHPVDNNGCGIAYCMYRISTDNGSTWSGWSDKVTNGSDASINLSTQGVYIAQAYVEDTCGNNATITSGVYQLDLTPPQVTYNPNSQTWTNSPFNVTVTPTDAGGSGLASYKYRLSSDGGSTWGDFSPATNAAAKTASYTLSGSNQTQSQTYSISDIGSVTSVTTTNGSATFSQNGTNVTVNCTGGTAMATPNYTGEYRSVTYTTPPQTSSSFSDTYYYTDADGYSGYITHSGSPVATTIPADSQYFSEELEAPYVTCAYTCTGFDGSGNPTYSQSYSFYGTQPPSSELDYEGDYSGTLYMDMSATKDCWASLGYWTTWNPFTKSSKVGDTYDSTLEVPLYYSGTETRPASTTYTQTYSGNITKSVFSGYTYTYTYPVTIHYLTAASGIPSSVTVPITSTGKWVIQTVANDNAGNSSTVNSGEYDVDMIAPTAAFSPASASNSPPMSVTITPADTGGSGVKQYQYRTSTNNGSSWSSWSASVTGDSPTSVYLSVTGTSLIQVQVSDNAGNVSTVNSGQYAINNSLPSVTYNPPSASWTNQAVPVTITPVDNSGVGISRYTYKISSDGGSTWGTPVTVTGSGSTTVSVSAEGTGEISTTITDTHSRSATVVSGKYLIDKTPPTVNLTDNGKMNLNDISFSIAPSDPVSNGVASGVDTASYECQVDGGAWEPFSGNDFYPTDLTTGTHTVTVRVSDIAGNTTTQSVTVDLAAQGDLTGTLYVNGTYDSDTDVTGAVNVSNNSPNDITPDENVVLSVNAGGQIITKTIICPANKTSWIPFKFHTPVCLSGSSQMNITAQIDATNVVQETDETNNTLSQDVTIASTAYTEPPHTTYQPTAPSSWQNVSPTEYDSSNERDWQEWRYEGGSFTLKDFYVRVTASMQLTPDSRIPSSKLGDDGIWTMRSGYGFTDATTIHVTTNYDQPNFITTPQMVRAYFPEFNYDLKNGVRQLDAVSATGTPSDYTTTYAFKPNDQSRILARLHFTPLWFPDKPYVLQETARDIWTPNGQIYLWGTSSVNIKGSVYDDWNVGIVKNPS